MTDSWTVARVLAARLRALGCRHAFGIPGGEVLSLLEALRAEGIAVHLTRHETAAGMMAEGTFHATRAPGVVVATIGPGVANCLNAAAQARLDRVPLVFLTGDVPDAVRPRYTHQIFPQREALAPVMQHAARLAAREAPAQIDAALAALSRGRPGPVLLEVPFDVADAPAAAPGAGTPEPARAADSSTLGAARAALAAAERPLVIAGLDLARAEGGDALRRFAEAVPAPVLTTYKAIGTLPPDHPRWLGAAGLSPKADAILLPLVKRADVVLLAGYDPVEMRQGWIAPFTEEQTVIELVPEPIDHAVHRHDLAVVGPVTRSLDALRPTLGTTWPDGEPGAAREALAEAFAATDGPEAWFRALRAAVDEEAAVAVDTGAHRIVLSQLWGGERPQRLLQSSGLCTMGYALPAALGYALAAKEPTVAVVGDGGVEMVLGELGTLRDTGAPVTVVIVDDRSLALIELKQRRRGLPRVAVDFGPTDGFAGTDYVGVARAFELDGERVEDPGALGAAVRRGLAAGAGYVVHAVLPRRAYDDRL